jgi:hypothetical protein
MAQWTLVYEQAVPVPFIVADGAGIEKGTLLKLADGMVASASGAADVGIICGVAAEEKIANDGKTRLGVYMRGIFRATCGGNCTAGVGLMCHGATGDPNDVINATNAAVGFKCLGTALDTGTDGETILVELRPGTSPGAFA